MLLCGHLYALRAVLALSFGDADLAVSHCSSLCFSHKPALPLGLKAPWLIRAVACRAYLALDFFLGICVLSQPIKGFRLTQQWSKLLFLGIAPWVDNSRLIFFVSLTVTIL